MIYNRHVYLCKSQNGETAWQFAFLPPWWRLWACRRGTRSRFGLPASVSLRLLAIAARKRPSNAYGACAARCLLVSSSTVWKRMKGDLAFLDTNVLVYAFAKDD